MRALFWLLAVFAAAVAFAIMGRGNDGYALFVYPPWRVELSLIFFFILLVAAFAALYMLARLTHHTLKLPVHVRAYRERRRLARASSLASRLSDSISRSRRASSSWVAPMRVRASYQPYPPASTNTPTTAMESATERRRNTDTAVDQIVGVCRESLMPMRAK